MIVVVVVKRRHRAIGLLQNFVVNSVRLYFSMLPSTFPCACVHAILKLTLVLPQKSEGVE